MKEYLYIAVDLGAGSGRVFLAGLDSDELFFEEISRFKYPPKFENEHLRWNFPLIFGEIKNGLRKAGGRAREIEREIYSVGVDSWAVDYGLLDADGQLIANPVCYRDERTGGVMEEVFAQISRTEIFEKTGIQFLSFNTLYQLFSDTETLRPADKFLLLPDLINYFLTGKVFCEYTNATTTQFFNAETCSWDFEIFDNLNLPKNILPEIVAAGTDLGFIKPKFAAELNLPNVRVTAPASHDTASAVIGAPLGENEAFISSGTWSLVGIERNEVLINKEVARHNFTNEGGAFGTIRFLKNVMGLWIFESCRREWEETGVKTDYAFLLEEVKRVEGFCGFIFPDDERFLNPVSMLAAIEEQISETGQTIYKSPVLVTKIILDSLAFRYAAILRTIENLTAQKLSGVQIIGGGGRNDYLNQMTANACQITVKAGLTEATVTGNVLVQAISAGRFENIAVARRYVAEKIELKEFAPHITSETPAAKLQYEKIESLFTKESGQTK